MFVIFSMQSSVNQLMLKHTNVKRTMVVMLFVLMLQNWMGSVFANGVLPCDFRDSINITDGKRGSNDTIEFNKLLFYREQYAEINYKFNIKTQLTESTAPYLRGCPCKIKPCIRLCCPFGTVYNKRNCTTHEASGDLVYEIIDSNKKTKLIHLNEEFSFVYPRLSGKHYTAGDFKITHNGDILVEDNKLRDQHAYCLLANLSKSASISLILLITGQEDTLKLKDIVYATAMLTSVAFIAVTFLVYLFVPELRNLHGKFLLCYLTALMIGYSLLAYIKFNGWHPMKACIKQIIGYSTYFSLLSAFFWSNVISFDLHRNFRKKRFFKSISEKNKFIAFVIYGCGVPLLLTFMVYMLDQFEPFQQEWLPGIGTATAFLKPAKYGKLSPFLYFYMIICVIYFININFFILTALKIRAAQQEIIQITSEEDSSRHQNHLNNERDNIIMYCRLFIVMGVFWIMEGVTFLIEDPDKTDSTNIFIWIVDIWNLSQGAIVFGLFVMKRRVLNLIKKRCDTFRSESNAIVESGNSLKTSNTTDR